MKYVPVVPREYWPELRGQVEAVAVAEPAAEDTDYIVVDIVAVVNMYDLRIEFAVVAVANDEGIVTGIAVEHFEGNHMKVRKNKMEYDFEGEGSNVGLSKRLVLVLHGVVQEGRDFEQRHSQQLG